MTRVKIGNYSIPKLRLFPNIYNDVKLIYENYKLEEVPDENVAAKLLGHTKASGGYWFSKRADMRLYGLLEPRKFKLTLLAQKLTVMTEEDKQEATEQAILNIPLWKELHSNFGAKLPDSNFWVQLQRITGLDPLEAQKHAEIVRKAYLEDIRHIKPVKEEIQGGPEVEPNIVDTSNTTTTQEFGEADLVKGLIQHGAFEIAKNFIDFIANKIKTETEEPEKEL